jgi:uncharacterized membrane protein (DUF485 family)
LCGFALLAPREANKHVAGLPELPIETEALFPFPLLMFFLFFQFNALCGYSSSFATQHMQDLLSSSIVLAMLDDIVSLISMSKVLYFLPKSEFQSNAVEKR